MPLHANPGRIEMQENLLLRLGVQFEASIDQNPVDRFGSKSQCRGRVVSRHKLQVFKAYFFPLARSSKSLFLVTRATRQSLRNCSWSLGSS